MSFLCLWSPVWQSGEMLPGECLPLLLEEAPRVAVEARGVVWVDGRGMRAERLAERLLERLSASRIGSVFAGVAAVPIAAEIAARSGRCSSRRAKQEEGALEESRSQRRHLVTVVAAEEEARFLAPLSLALLSDDEQFLALLEGSGIRTCGELAGLTPGAIEVRFGSEGVRLWKLARADDRRLLFRPIPPERPHASVDFVDYTVQDATQLVFTLNALLDQVCGILNERGKRARAITLTFTLASGEVVHEVLRTTRPTADRSFWIRRFRAALERIHLTDAITGTSVEVGVSDPISALQGDLFDRGFATAISVEETVVRLLDTHPALFVRQTGIPHPLAERRVQWEDLAPREVVESGRREEDERTLSAIPSLSLQLLHEPRPIQVRTRVRRDHLLPVGFHDGSKWHVLDAAGPDMVSGGHEEEQPWAREYFRCVSDEGALLWIYRDGAGDHWYLHGWWD